MIVHGVFFFRLGPLADDARHVIKRQWIYLDRSKKTTRPPDSLVLPDEDMGIGRICVSVVFRPIEVNDTTFAYGEESRRCRQNTAFHEFCNYSISAESLPGRQALTADGTKRPRNKTVRNEARRLAAGSARLDPNGGPVRAPIFYPKVRQDGVGSSTMTLCHRGIFV